VGSSKLLAARVRMQQKYLDQFYDLYEVLCSIPPSADSDCITLQGWCNQHVVALHDTDRTSIS